MTNLEVGDIVLCTVDRIVGTVVFVKIDETQQEGSIILSEIAPGRIRNLREYVVPKKKIVCKVLRISGDRIDLSLRRVTQKEQKELKEQYKQEQSYRHILKSVLGKKADDIIRKITNKEKLYNFLQKAKEDPEKLEDTVGKTESRKILDILKTQKQKRGIIKREIFLTTTNPNGLELIKKTLEIGKNIEIKSISAGRYIIKIESEDLKKADNQIRETINQIEEKTKKAGMEFKIKEK